MLTELGLWGTDWVSLYNLGAYGVTTRPVRSGLDLPPNYDPLLMKLSLKAG